VLSVFPSPQVCLSILGTWSGPGWVPGLSTLGQVLISIQSAILVEAPIENEPGHENHTRTAAGRVSVAIYNAALRVAALRVGMLNVLKAPPAAFARAVRGHFWHKREELIAQVRAPER